MALHLEKVRARGVRVVPLNLGREIAIERTRSILFRS
jgi:hypothetical protein